MLVAAIAAALDAPADTNALHKWSNRACAEFSLAAMVDGGLPLSRGDRDMKTCAVRLSRFCTLFYYLGVHLAVGPSRAQLAGSDMCMSKPEPNTILHTAAAVREAVAGEPQTPRAEIQPKLSPSAQAEANSSESPLFRRSCSPASYVDRSQPRCRRRPCRLCLLVVTCSTASPGIIRRHRRHSRFSPCLRRSRSA